MDLPDRLLERLRQYDAWTTRKLLLVARALPTEDLDQEFDLALRSLRATLAHIVHNVEA